MTGRESVSVDAVESLATGEGETLVQDKGFKGRSEKMAVNQMSERQEMCKGRREFAVVIPPSIVSRLSLRVARQSLSLSLSLLRLLPLVSPSHGLPVQASSLIHAPLCSCSRCVSRREATATTSSTRAEQRSRSCIQTALHRLLLPSSSFSLPSFPLSLSLLFFLSSLLVSLPSIP